jgi:hypothetical protein
LLDKNKNVYSNNLQRHKNAVDTAIAKAGRKSKKASKKYMETTHYVQAPIVPFTLINDYVASLTSSDRATRSVKRYCAVDGHTLDAKGWCTGANDEQSARTVKTLSSRCVCSC